jgi:hypothetical protein
MRSPLAYCAGTPHDSTTAWRHVYSTQNDHELSHSMSASTEELIAINSLLIEREAEFARVHSIEAQISALLGAEYPFDPPEVIIPSTIKKKAIKTKPAAKEAAIKIRRLADREIAYRFSWLDKSQAVTNELTELKAVDALINDTLPGMKLLKVETLDFDSATVQTLYEAE